MAGHPMRKKLRDQEPAGIGRVLLNSQIENRREILWYGREQIANLPEAIKRCTGSDFISRTYRIIADGQPVMLINEKFPVEANHALGNPARTSEQIKRKPQ